jgi:hypothetical protein
MAQVNGGERRGIIMTEETKSVVSVPDYLAFITKVMRENEEFLHENAKEAYNEVVELVNDAIDLAKQGVKEKSITPSSRWISSYITFSCPTVTPSTWICWLAIFPCALCN